MSAKLPKPDAKTLFEIVQIAKQYDPDEMAKMFIVITGGLIATGRNPARTLAELQTYLAQQVKDTIDNLPDTLKQLDAARAEFDAMTKANKGLRRKH
jgi:uncharacterized protein (DUF3084 family)